MSLRIRRGDQVVSYTLWLLSFLNSTLTDIILVMLRSHYSQLCLSVKLHASVSLLFLVVLLLVLLVLLFPMLCPLFPMLTLSSCCSLCYSCSFSSHHLSGLVSASLGHLRSTYTSCGIPLSVSTVFPISPGRSLTASRSHQQWRAVPACCCAGRALD